MMAEADTFNTGEMKDALADVTNQDAEAKKTEASALAREKGWVAPQGYNYDAYNASTTEEREAVGAASLLWASSAEKYEWSEEYGDIGPPHPDLEKVLFKNDYLNRAGVKFDQ